jgi:hypothetical protein
VSDAHLKTRAKRQYGLIPESELFRSALITISVNKKAMEMNMHPSMTPNLGLILTRPQTLNMYVLDMISISFHVVKIHHGSRTSASHGRMRKFAVEPKLLKYSKLDQASATQKGWTAIREPMKK